MTRGSWGVKIISGKRLCRILSEMRINGRKHVVRQQKTNSFPLMRRSHVDELSLCKSKNSEKEWQSSSGSIKNGVEGGRDAHPFQVGDSWHRY